MALSILCFLGAETKAEPGGSAPSRGAGSAAQNLAPSDRSYLNISPIFSELVLFSAPGGFGVVFEKTENTGTFYIREMVPKGESAERWSQMITVTGAQGLAANPGVTAQSFLERMADGFKQACPTTFSAKPLGEKRISGHEAFVLLAGCGALQAQGAAHSEAALLIGVKGAQDYYTIQWAERGAASNEPLDLSGAKWQERLAKLEPIKFCLRKAGEAPPYPSCIAQK
ncbi:hypothetical protein B1812_10550 [Methylocystis bryophila]|uniref:Uncharacterized protein n=1 Tax=Methylocystis bryophila TaxID=655015 RepID=A0A1W6N172_9HYPH|nr:hypothetical protein B1812_10550 [Methylocystis bryophila]